MPRVLTCFIEERQASRVYACATCKTHLSTEGNVMSKDFTTQNGRGFLVNGMVNVTKGPSDDRSLRTGTHTCRDVYCVTCDTAVGWEYLGALERGQKYKIGNFVLDMTRTVRYHWESAD
ncbi:unnamed protein product [Hapterophycus canaliculatus]